MAEVASGRNTCKRAASGFTLIEVLIATGIALLIGLAAVSVLQMSFRGLGEIVDNKQGEQAAELLDLSESFHEDVFCALKKEDEPSFLGGERGFSLLRLYSQYRSEASLRVVRVEWGHSAAGNVMRTIRVGEEILAQKEWSEVGGVHFTYAKKDKKQVSWKDEWVAKELPLAVRIKDTRGLLALDVFAAAAERSDKQETVETEVAE